jgi:phosphonopyruvate decarboxylase
MVGSMGCAAGFGLGLARAQPRRQVLVLDGDGALLMKLGTLASIGGVAPANLHHVVFDNGVHDSTGGQPTASPNVDFAAVALACGYRLAETRDEEADFAPALERHLAAPGPTLLRLLCLPGARKELGRPRLQPRDGWRRFCAFLAEGPAS